MFFEKEQQRVESAYRILYITLKLLLSTDPWRMAEKLSPMVIGERDRWIPFAVWNIMFFQTRKL